MCWKFDFSTFGATLGWTNSERMNDGTCCVCFGEYNDVNCIPVVSSCGHTVCRNCSSSLKKLNNSSNVHCPTCRTLVPYPMPTNFSLISILTSMKSSLSSRHQHPSSNNIQQFTYDEIQKTIKNSIFLGKT